MRHMIFAAALVVSAYANAAQETGPYARGMAALKNGDCATAVAEFTQFKNKYSEQLRAKPKFAALIDEQIATCGTPRAGHGGGAGGQSSSGGGEATKREPRGTR